MKLTYRMAASTSMLALVTVLPLTAQTSSGPSKRTVEPNRYTFVVVDRSDIHTIQGDWQKMGALLRYVHEHHGSYIAFGQGGTVYRLDRAEQMAEVGRLASPLQVLEVQQQALEQAQEPLARQQRAFSKRQSRAASPEEKDRLGSVQGAIGEEQGELGSLEGEVGKQRGELGRAIFDRLQVVFAQCVADGSCARVS